MKFASANNKRIEAGLAVFRSLFEWTDLNPVTLWWVVYAASSLPHPESAGTYESVLDLIATLREIPPAPACRPPAQFPTLRSRQ